jgi:two-component system chemotaxis sensor kinase CheA
MSDQTNFGETFFQEAEDLLIVIEERILDLESDPRNRDAVDGLFRAIHTIKGSGAMFGFDDIAGFAHHVETTLDDVRNGDLKISRELIDLILTSRDQIKAMLYEAKGGEVSDQTSAEEIVQQLKRLPKAIVETDSSDRNIKYTIDKPSNTEKMFRIKFKPDPGIFSSGMDPLLLIDELRDLGECTITPLVDDVPELSLLEPEQCYLNFIAILTTSHDIGIIKDVFIFVEDTSVVDIMSIDMDDEDNVPKIGDILVERGDTTRLSVANALSQQKRLGDILMQEGDVSKDQVESALIEQQVIRKKKDAKLKETIRVPADKLDRLVNLVGELVITQAQLQSVATTLDSFDFSTPVEEIGRLTTELRDIALNVRMMPIGSTFNRFRRLVRDLSTELRKKINLETYGAETEMDKTLIERMGDLLVHLIRNSIDHGIESPEVRKSTGKCEEGTIRLFARHEGAKVVISIEDDGRGIDLDRLRKKALEKGIIGEAQKLTKQETLGLVMTPGFSTADEVSNISGRGVGMDVVKKEIAALRGEVEIQSEKGLGTQIRLSLPLTLPIIDGLLVSVGGYKYIIPVAIVAECLEITKDNLAMGRRRNLLTLRGNYIPFVRLRDIFHVDAPEPTLEEAVLVEVDETLVGIVVDHIVGDHQTVIKSLGKLYRNVIGISGATILGDGAVALIADIPSILKIANRQEKEQVTRIRKLSLQ